MSVVNIRHIPARAQRADLPAGSSRAVVRNWPVPGPVPPPPPAPGAQLRAPSPSRGWRSPRRRAASSRGNRPVRASRTGARARADRSAAGDRAGRRHDLHRPGPGPAAQSRTAARSHDMSFDGMERRAGRPLRLGQPDLHRPAPRPGQVPAALGQPAADRDPGRTGAEARLDRRTGRRASRPVSGLPPGDEFDAALAAQGQGIPGGPRPQGRRHRRRRHDRRAEPRRAIL